jgi:hypothetical protein
MSIVSKLLQRQCIKINYESPLPCPSYFVNHLFKEYAQNNVISKANLQKLMKNLMIGKHGNRTKVNVSQPEDKFARKKRRTARCSSAHRHTSPASIYEKVCEIQIDNYTMTWVYTCYIRIGLLLYRLRNGIDLESFLPSP